ncbi:MAG: fatty acid desaturase [Rhodocyclaceae bacterium]|jgi:fatty acid desaturase|nr:fatty acid desaturase [Rhodocyclaceae bacterium]
MFRCSNDEARRGDCLNRRLILVFSLYALLPTLVVPLMLLPLSPAWGGLLVPLVLLTNSWWAFQHEAMHGTLLHDKRANRLIGRLHAIAFGASFDLLRWGHLLHHAHSRTIRERSEVHEGERPSVGFVVAYYLRIGGGLYLAEVIGTLVLLLPRAVLVRLVGYLDRPDNVVGELGVRLLEAPVLRAARIDALCVLLFHTGVFWFYGEYAWMYALALAGRALAVSFVDNAFHYGTALDEPRRAMNLALPPPLSALILHFNLHGAHHLRPGLPWWQLPSYHRAHDLGYQHAWWPALFRQLRGPIGAARFETA